MAKWNSFQIGYVNPNEDTLTQFNKALTLYILYNNPSEPQYYHYVNAGCTIEHIIEGSRIYACYIVEPAGGSYVSCIFSLTNDRGPVRIYNRQGSGSPSYSELTPSPYTIDNNTLYFYTRSSVSKGWGYHDWKIPEFNTLRDLYSDVFDSKFPITYIGVNSTLSGPESASSGDTVTADVSFPDGYNIKHTGDGGGISVYNQDGSIPFTYTDGKITFTMP